MMPPYDYQQLNLAAAKNSPSTIHTHNTQLYWYYVRYLLQMAIAQFKWSIPDNWEKDYFLYTLYGRGYCAIIDTDKFGVIPQQCELSGLNVFYHPTTALIANPLLPGLHEKTINVDCVIFKLQPDYSGIMDKVAYYADMMALCDEVSTVNLFNSQLSYVFTTPNKNAAESLKKMYDVLHSGNPAVVIDKAMINEDGSKSWESFDQNISNNFVVDKLQLAQTYWKNQFLTDLGIPNANRSKRERLITDEVNANNVETAILPDLWLEHLKSECDRCNTMFGTAISVDWRFNPLNGGENDAGYNFNNGANAE